MSEPTILTPFTEFWAKVFERYVIDPLFRFLERRSPRTRALLIVISGALVILSAVWAIWSLTTYSRFMAATFAQPLEPNDQSYRGLEAYLLSNMDHPKQGVWGSALPAQEIAALDGKLAHTAWSQALRAPWNPTKDDGLIPVHLDAKHKVSETYYTQEDSTRAFLFLPAIMMDDALMSSGADGGIAHHRASDSLPRLPAHIAEIRLARRCVPILDTLDNQTIDGLPVVQSYFMGDQGTLMIRNNAKHSGAPYGGKFPPSRYFPERPYFKKAGLSRNKIGSFDYVTQPYIDFGGFGVVRTYTLRLELPNGHIGMIGIDCKFPNGDSLIKAQIQSLLPPWKRLGTPEPVTFDLRFTPQGANLESEHVPDWVSKAAVETRSSAEVQGQILCDHDYGASGQTYEFAIPMGPGDQRGGEETTNYLLAVLDLNAMKNVWVPGALCVAMCVLFGGILQFLYQRHIAQPKEQAAILRGVSRMMADAETPFAWLDSKNRFVRANGAMARVLGYASAEELIRSPIGRRRTFREFLMLEDLGAYDAMLDHSRRGRVSSPYWCRMRHRGGKWVLVQVHGERMPLSGARRGEGPNRFGVFLKWEPAEYESHPDRNGSPETAAAAI